MFGNLQTIKQMMGIIKNANNPQAQSTGTSPSFTTLVQATDNNSKCCPCSAPTSVSVISTTASTYADVNIVVTKVV